MSLNNAKEVKELMLFYSYRLHKRFTFFPKKMTNNEWIIGTYYVAFSNEELIAWFLQNPPDKYDIGLSPCIMIGEKTYVLSK